MNISTSLILLGLAVNTIASLIMLWPYLKVTQNVEDDFIEHMDQKTGDYTQTKHRKNKNLGIIGFSLFSVGFMLQFIGIILGL